MPPAIRPGTPKMAYPIATKAPIKPIFIFSSLVFNCIYAASLSYLFPDSMLSYTLSIFYSIISRSAPCSIIIDFMFSCTSAWVCKRLANYSIYDCAIFIAFDDNYFYTIFKQMRRDIYYSLISLLIVLLISVCLGFKLFFISN